MVTQRAMVRARFRSASPRVRSPMNTRIATAANDWVIHPRVPAWTWPIRVS